MITLKKRKYPLQHILKQIVFAEKNWTPQKGNTWEEEKVHSELSEILKVQCFYLGK